jgi:hypothetical protein
LFDLARSSIRGPFCKSQAGRAPFRTTNHAADDAGRRVRSNAVSSASEKYARPLIVIGWGKPKPGSFSHLTTVRGLTPYRSETRRRGSKSVDCSADIRHLLVWKMCDKENVAFGMKGKATL